MDIYSLDGNWFRQAGERTVMFELAVQQVKGMGKLILVIWLVSKISLALAITPGDYIWTGGTCCGQNQPQFIHDPAALVSYFLTTPLPLGSPQATTFPSYTTCLSPPTAIGQSCYVYAWYTNIPYTSEDNCPIPGLTPLTDPVALLYENGTYSTTKPDLVHLTLATQTGLACIQQKVAALNCYMTPKPTSGYRPTAYQTHILDVYDKWQLIKNNNSTVCAARKAAIQKEFNMHSRFARRPGVTSNHSQLDAQGNPAGNAVDISFVPDDVNIHADTIACQCNMYRPLINMPDPTKNDPVHYQPRTCLH